MFLEKAFLLLVVMSSSGEPRVMGIWEDMDKCKVQAAEETKLLQIRDQASQFDKWVCQQILLPTRKPDAPKR